MQRFFSSSRGTIIKSLQKKSLQQSLSEKIALEGPLSFATYMEMCLFDSEFGYYNKGKIFGKQGDFITSPEISQLFGESLAVWCATVYNLLDKPSKWHIVEIGPGKGTLAADVLRTLKGLQIHKGLSLHFIDLSSHLKKIQQQSIINVCGQLQYEKFKGLDRYFDKDISAYWYNTLPEMTQHYIQDYKEQPVVVVGHEIFDALPVFVFEFTAEGWKEVLVNFNEHATFELTLSKGQNDNVKKILRPEMRFPGNKIHSFKEGDRIELSPASQKLANDICSLVKIGKSCGLVIDYGENRAFNDSIRVIFIQGIKNHEKLPASEWLQMPGEVDISAYVDFAAIRNTVSQHPELMCSPAIPQGLFLESMGISARVEILSQKNPSKKEKLWQDYERLASPSSMGEIYKALYIGNKSLGEVYPFTEEIEYEAIKV